MDVREAIYKRRSIRKFKDVAVPFEALERCVDAGRLAPAGRNWQVLEYAVVDDPVLLSQVYESITIWGGIKAEEVNTPPRQRPRAYIVILINRQFEEKVGRSRALTVYDVGMAAENVLLAAVEEGLSSCPVLSYNADKVKKALNAPHHYDVGLVLAMGYADEESMLEVAEGTAMNYHVDEAGTRHVPKRKLADIMCRNRFGQKP